MSNPKLGFTFKTVLYDLEQNRNRKICFGVWDTDSVQPDLPFLATKGFQSGSLPGRSSGDITYVEEHSKKPAEARERIVKLMGDLPRIELFARQQSPGWDVWGNEVESSLDMGKLQENRGKEKVGELCSLQR